MKKIYLCLFLIGTMLLTACTGGPLSKLDSTLDYAPFFFDGLTISGKITVAQADVYKHGVTRFETIAENTKTCLSENVLPDAQCYLNMGTESKNAIAEFYPQVTEGKVAQYVQLLQDVVALIIRKNTPSVGQALPPADIDAKLSAKIDELNTLLKSEKR